QGEPIPRRVVPRRRARVGRDHSREVQRLAGRGRHVRRIDQPIAAHPDCVGRLGKGGDQVASLIVGDDDADELGRQIVRFGDHPHPGLRPVRTRDHAGDVGWADGNTLGGEGPRRKVRGETDDYHMDEPASNRAHVASVTYSTLGSASFPSPEGRGEQGVRTGTRPGQEVWTYTHARYRSFTNGTSVSSGMSHTPWLKISTSMGPA